MVLGINEGKLELLLDKTSFSPGDPIVGTVRLTVDNPKKARGLRVEFYGLHKRGSKTVRVHHVSQELAPPRSYRMGEQFKFMLIVPYNALPRTHDGLFASVSSFFSGSSTEWYVSASLDLPMKLDLSDKKKVELVRDSGSGKPILHP